MNTQEQPVVRPGTYRHFKGGMYRVQFVAMLVDSERQYVVYHKIGDDNCAYLRDKNEFAERVVVDGAYVPRFQYIDETDRSSSQGAVLGDKRRVVARRLLPRNPSSLLAASSSARVK